MEQRIRFCDSVAGRVAYAVAGEGSPLVLPAPWIGHLELTWSNPACRAFVEALGERHTVIRYDAVGTGLSERERRPGDFSLGVELSVLEDLIEALELDRFSLLGISSGGPTAGAYAAAHPKRVKRLVLYGTYADGSRIADAKARASLTQTVREHWGLGSRVLASVFLPDAGTDELRWFTELQREGATPETAARMLALTYELDATDSYKRVAAPALVLHRRDDQAIHYRRGVEVASLIPDARLEPLEGSIHLPWFGDTAGVLEAMAEFMRLGPYPLEAVDGGPGVGLAAEAPSEREVEVIGLVAEGLSDDQIAERLVLSPHTVHRHMANIRRKLGQPSRAAAAAAATRAGLI